MYKKFDPSWLLNLKNKTRPSIVPIITFDPKTSIVEEPLGRNAGGSQKIRLSFHNSQDLSELIPKPTRCLSIKSRRGSHLIPRGWQLCQSLYGSAECLGQKAVDQAVGQI